jgi:putative ABC transport system permease protein
MKWLRSILVRFWFSVQMAGHGILSNPVRSALTVLGVAIGVASVVTLMGIGEGARQAVVEQFESLGTNVVVVKAEAPSLEFGADRAEQLVERVEGLELATPVVKTEGVVRWRRARGTLNLLGVNEDFPQVRDHELAAGHFFTRWHVKQRSPVAVLGHNVGVGLLGGRNPVGQTLTLEGRTYRIVGVLTPKGSGNADNVDDKVLIPYTAAQQIAQRRTVQEIWAKAGSREEARLAVVQLGRIFRRELGLAQDAPTGAPEEPERPQEPGPPQTIQPAPQGQSGPKGADKPAPIAGLESGKKLITITNLNKLVREADRANWIMTLLLGGIAAVSLLVGGLGIMNIMLVAVTERTGEIGVRRALGAKQLDLVVQFLLEALYLSGIGVVAGVAAGIWGTKLFAQSGFDTVVSLKAVTIAAGVALGSGLLFGVYPAISASSIPPAEALRKQ